MNEQQQALQAAHDQIRALEKIKNELETQISAAYKVYHALYNALQLPDVEGEEYPDQDTSHWWGAEKATYKAYALHRPHTNEWAGCVEWLLNGHTGASDPEIGANVATADVALAWANAKAKENATFGVKETEE